MSLDPETMNKIFSILQTEDTPKSRPKKKRELTEEARDKMRARLHDARIKALEKKGYKVVKEEEKPIDSELIKPLVIINELPKESVKPLVIISEQPKEVVNEEPKKPLESELGKNNLNKKEYKKDFKPIDFSEDIKPIESPPQISAFRKYLLNDYFKQKIKF